MKIKLAIGLLVSALCLTMVLRGVDLSAVASAFRAADARWLVAATALYGFAYVFRALRWATIFRGIHPISAWRLLPLLLIGFMANNLLPFRMGELVRVDLTGSALKIPRSSAMATVVVERLVDMISVLGLFILLALTVEFPESVRKGVYSFTGVAISALFSLGVILWQQERLLGHLSRFRLLPSRWRESLGNIIGNFLQSLHRIHKGRTLAQAMAYSIPVWFVEGAIVYLICRAFGISIPLLQAFVVLFFIAISVTLPQAPGYVGPYEYFGVLALGLSDIPKELALPAILTLHAMQFVYIFIGGMISLMKEGLSWKTAVRPS